MLFSSPMTKLGESTDRGNDFSGLVVTFFEDDHNSSELPRLACPNIGSSLLQDITCEDIMSDCYRCGKVDLDKVNRIINNI